MFTIGATRNRREGLDYTEVGALDHLLYFWLVGLILVYHVTLTAMIALTQLNTDCSCPIQQSCFFPASLVSF